MRKLLLISTLLFTFFYNSSAQTVYHHISNSTIYEFLDEMATIGYIELASVVKPYSREFIAKKLLEIENNKETLNKRQLKELNFFLQDFKKEIMTTYNRATDKKNKRYDLFFYKDSLFTVSVNPIGGMQVWNNNNGSVTHRWNGAEAFSYIGKWGIYASLRDNNESELLAKESYLTQRMGYENKGTGDYSEMRGGITYTWKWGSVGLIKDHFEWGNNYNGANIFSGRTPSFAHITLNLKPVSWFEFNYKHGWLISEEVDSTRSYQIINSYGTTNRDVLHEKYLATNIFTFKPLKKLFISFGNSIIYSDIGVEPSYLIPIFFFKSIDHTLNSADQSGSNIGQNSQMFFDISSRQIKYLHLYSTLFIDELSIERFKEYNGKINFISLKAGIQISNLIPNTSLIFEYTKTKPLAFQHNISTTTFESNGYNLGHYLKDNTKEYFIKGVFRPFRGLTMSLSYTLAKKGKDYTALGNEGPNNGTRIGLPYMDSVEWKSETILAKTRWEVFNDVFLFGEIMISNITGKTDLYTPEFLYGKNTTISVGFNIGF